MQPSSYSEIIQDASLEERRTVALESIAASLEVLADDKRLKRLGEHMAQVRNEARADVPATCAERDRLDVGYKAMKPFIAQATALRAKIATGQR